MLGVRLLGRLTTSSQPTRRQINVFQKSSTWLMLTEKRKNGIEIKIEIDAVLGCDIATLKHVQEAGDSPSTTSSSADSENPLDVSAESSMENEPLESAFPPKSCLERKKGFGKRKRKPEDADGGMQEHFKRAYDEIKSQGEKMQEMQM